MGHRDRRLQTKKDVNAILDAADGRLTTGKPGGVRKLLNIPLEHN